MTITEAKVLGSSDQFLESREIDERANSLI